MIPTEVQSDVTRVTSGPSLRSDGESLQVGCCVVNGT